MLADVEACLAAGARQVFIVDDNFAGNKRLGLEVLTELAACWRCREERSGSIVRWRGDSTVTTK